MGKSKSVTVGYTYYMAFHMGVVRAANSIVRVAVGDKEAWKGVVEDNTTINIDKPELFGGKKAEGGVKGPAEIMFGGEEQEASGALKKMLSGSENGRVPGFRGFVSVFFDGMFAQMNPYPKRWAFRVRRSTAGWSKGAWYPSKAMVLLGDIDKDDPEQVAGLKAIHAMNPAHIILYAFTEPYVGRGLPREALDLDTFREAADRLYDEGFGLCITWTREESVGDFIQMVLDHIGGATFQDRRTGLIKLKLIRDDYDPDTLPVYTVDSGILSITQAEVAAQPAVVSEVIVTYTNPVADNKGQVRSHNLAVLQDGDGAVYSTTLEYLGLPTSKLANQVAQRELKARSVGLRRFKIRFDRRGYQLEPGGVFRLTDPTRGISNMVLRIADYDDGTMTDNTVTISAVQDIFSFQLSTFTDAQPDEHIPVSMTPALARRVVYEVPYVNLINQMSADDFERLTAESGFLGVGAEQPTGTHMSYEIHTKREGEAAFSNTGTGDFIPLGELPNSIEYLDTEIRMDRTVSTEDMEPGMALMIGDEIMALEAIEFPDGETEGATAVMTVLRGVADTIPQRHAAREVVWFYDDDIGTDEHEYVEGENLELKVLPWTLLGGTFPEDLAPSDYLEFRARYTRPYPPGRVLLDGQPWFTKAEVEDEDPLQLTWTHRDRPGQVDRLIGHEEGNIGPEPGVTYHITVRDEDGDVIREIDDITGTSWTYDLDTALADFGETETNADITRTAYINLESIRTADNDQVYGSWQSYDMSATFRAYKFWMQVASLARNVAMTAAGYDDNDGIYVAQLYRTIAEQDSLPPIEGPYVASVARAVGQRTAFPESPGRLVMERPFILQKRAGASLLSHNLITAAAQPADLIPDWYTLYAAENGTASTGNDAIPPSLQDKPKFPTAPAADTFAIEEDEVAWARWAKTGEQLEPLTTTIQVVSSSVTTGQAIAGLPAGTIISIDSELMSVVSATATSIEVKRGVADTVPSGHWRNSTMWVLQNTSDPRTGDTRNYANGTVVATKYLPQQFAGPVDLAALGTDQVLVNNRVERPYPPGRVQMNGQPWFKSARISLPGDTITLTWEDRNRLTQGVNAVGHEEDGIAREAGTTYRLRLLGGTPEGGVVVFVDEELTGNSWTIDYDTARPIGFRAASLARVCGGGGVKFQLYAVRDGLACWQGYVGTMIFPGPACTGSNGQDLDDSDTAIGGGGSNNDENSGGPGTGSNPGNPPGPEPTPQPGDDNNQENTDTEEDPEPEDPNDPTPDPEEGPKGGYWSKNWGNQWGSDKTDSEES